MLDFRHIDAFRAVMKASNMVQAAKMVGISQPAISRLIAEMERETELVLFDRTSGRLRPLDAAKQLLEEVDRRYAGLEAIRQYARSLKDQERPPLVFGAVTSFAIGFAARAVKRFSCLENAAKVQIEMASSSLIRDLVSASKCDVALVTAGIDLSTVASKPFAKIDLVLAVPANDPMAKLPLITAAMLRERHLISHRYDDMVSWGLWQLFSEHDLHDRVVAETVYSANLCALVREGVGVGFVHPIAALDFVADGIVLRKFEQSLPIETILIRNHGVMPETVDSFAQELTLTLAEALADIEKLLQ